MRVLVNVVELNRRRHVELESITAALAEAVHAGEARRHTQLDGSELDPVRELVRALRALLVQPLPEALMAGTGEVPVELEAPAHELEQFADELDALADTAAGDEHPGLSGSLDSLAGRLRARAAAR